MYYGPRSEKEWEFTPLPDIDMGFRGQPKVDAQNTGYQPGGGQKQIFDSTLKWDAKPKIGSYDPKRLTSRRRRRSYNSDGALLSNRIHLPRLYTRDHVTALNKWEHPLQEMEEGTFVFYDKRRFNGEAKVGSLTNRDYKPKGGDVKILDEKPVWNANSKVKSLDNVTYSPRGGNVMIHDQKLNWNSKPKIDAENRSYSPSRGSKLIFQEKVNWNAKPKVGSLDNKDYVPSGGQVSIIDERPSWEKRAKVGSLVNKDYRPKGGDVQIVNETPRWSAAPKVGSLDKVNYKPKDAEVDIWDEKLFWNGEAKVNSFQNIHHRPGGGTKKIPMKIPAYPKGSLENLTQLFIYGPRASPRKVDASEMSSPQSVRTVP